MKSNFVTLAAFVAAASAQNASDLPQCGQTCVNNMLADSKASELGCDAGDRACLCLNPNFTYGVRDCSSAICDDNEVANIVEYAINLCSGAGVAITTDGGSATATRTGEGSDESASVTSVTITGTPSTIYSVFSSDGEATSTPVGTTIIGGVAGGSGNGNGDGDNASGVVTTITSDGSAIVSTISGAAGGIVTTITSDGSAIVSTITSAAGAVVTTISSDGSAFVSTITSAAGSASSRASEIAGSASSRASGIAGSASSAASSVLDNASSAITSAQGEASSAINDATGGNGEASSTETSDGAAVPQKTAAPVGIIAAAGLAAFLL